MRMISCAKCGMKHEENSSTYIKIHGNITIGNQKVLSGSPDSINRTDEDNSSLISPMLPVYYCFNCLIDELEEEKQKVIMDISSKIAKQQKVLDAMQVNKMTDDV